MCRKTLQLLIDGCRCLSHYQLLLYYYHQTLERVVVFIFMFFMLCFTMTFFFPSSPLMLQMAWRYARQKVKMNGFSQIVLKKTKKHEPLQWYWHPAQLHFMCPNLAIEEQNLAIISVPHLQSTKYFSEDASSSNLPYMHIVRHFSNKTVNANN